MLFPGSLRLRLILLASVVVLIAIAPAWLVLSSIFERHVESRITSELTDHLNQLIVNFREPKDGKPVLTRPLPDPGFNRPFSGTYWQISDKDGVLLKSRSLWDFNLRENHPVSELPKLHSHDLQGPEGSQLFSVIQNVTLDAGDGEKEYLIIVSLDHKEITRSVQDFSQDLLLMLSGLVLVFFIALWVQVSVGLRPFSQMKKELLELRQGRRQKLMESYPVEIKPVIQEINNFITSRELSAEYGRSRASDLAHGLKTPLAILTAESRRLVKQDQFESAEVLRQQISSMRRHVDHELARAKIQNIQHHRLKKAHVMSNVEKIISTLNNLPNMKRIEWRVDIPDDLHVMMESGDFMEVCGNLLENAQKWAKSKVDVRAHRAENGSVVLRIEDDGPGVSEDKFKTMLKRGRQLDETVSGSGLGLAIVSDMLSAYQYRMEPYQSAIGGLGMRLMLRSEAAATR